MVAGLVRGSCGDNVVVEVVTALVIGDESMVTVWVARAMLAKLVVMVVAVVVRALYAA